MFNLEPISSHIRNRVLQYTALVLAVALIAATIWRVSDWTSSVDGRLSQVERLLAQQAARIDETQRTLDTLVTNNKQLQDALEEARQKQREARRQIASTKQQFSSQLSQIERNVEELDEQTITDIADAWNERVGRIVCIYHDGGEKVGERKASAVLLQRDGRAQFVTNKHVVRDDTHELAGCAVRVPGHETRYDIPARRITAREDMDLAYLRVESQPDSLVRTASRVRECGEKPTIGRRVLILGYPKTGASDSITATEGIISGFTEDFYITSAKIERGNSGGAAIHVKNNCLLGIPTLAVVGRVESLARILPATDF